MIITKYGPDPVGVDTATLVDVTKPWSVAALLKELREARAEDALDTLADRTATHTDVTDPQRVTDVLDVLLKVKASQALAALADRAAADTDLIHPLAVGRLLQQLRVLEADQALSTLADRAAAHVGLTGLQDVPSLVARLRTLGTRQRAATGWGKKASTRVSMTPELRYHQLCAIDMKAKQRNQERRSDRRKPDPLLQFGRTPDGALSAPWAWADITDST